MSGIAAAEARPSRASVLGVLRAHRDFRRLIVAHLQSQLGTGAAYVALLLVAYQRLHSGWAVALVLLGDFLPGVVLSGPVGVLADRYDRRRLAVAGDVLRAVAFIGIAVISSFAGTVALALLAGVGTTLWRPAVAATLPGLVAPRERNAATAAYTLCLNLGATVGPGLCALLLLALSPAAVLGINGATFAVSAVLLSTVRFGAVGAVGSRAGEAPEAGEEPVGQRFRDGVRAAGRIHGLFALIILSALTILAGAMVNVAEPVLVVGPLHGGGSGFAVLVGLYGLGMIAGSASNARGAGDVMSLRQRLIVGIALTGVAMTGTSAAPTLLVAALTMLITGVGNAVIVGPQMRLLQELPPASLLGRVFGLYTMLENSAYVGGFLVSGALLATLGSRSVFLIAGLAILVMALVTIVAFHPAAGAPEAEPDSDVGLTVETVGV